MKIDGFSEHLSSVEGNLVHAKSRKHFSLFAIILRTKARNVFNL